MSTLRKTSQSTPKKASHTEELKTEPMSEKDEVKEAERKMAKYNKKASGNKKS